MRLPLPLLRGLIAGLALAAAVPAAAFPGAAAPADAATEAPVAGDAEIDQTADAASDARIAERIRNIFAAIDGLDRVQVRVSSGVVTLSGSVADSADRERAEAIAGRVAGVATVQNLVERSVEVDGEALSGLTGRVDELVSALPLIALAIGIAIVIALIGHLLAGLTGLWRRIASNAFLAELIATAIRFLFVVLGLVVALDVLGATALLGAVLGGAGVLGIALGFAMRDTIENYVASLLLSLRQPFRANDLVVIEGNEGRVVRLTSRATVLMTLDGNHLRIPNSTVFKAIILNYTRNPERRFEFVLGIDADDDPVAASALGVATLRSLDFVLADPEPGALIEEVGDSNIIIRFLGWVNQEQTDFLKARSRAIPAVKNALEAEGFAIPEPIYRLRFDAAAPLPLSGTTQADEGATPSAPAAKEKRPPRPAPARGDSGDSSPLHTVERMVDDERAQGGTEGDLLDSKRPVE